MIHTCKTRYLSHDTSETNKQLSLLSLFSNPKMAYKFVCVLLTIAMCAAPALSFSAGAPKDACDDMIPQHHTDPQKSAAPYKILLNKKQIKSGQGVTVTVQGNTPSDTIKGLLCQARVGETPVGSFDIPPSNNYIQTLSCGNSKTVSLSRDANGIFYRFGKIN